MPNTKQGGGVALTFSKKNEDVKEIIEKYKDEMGRAFIATDYVCEAIRFYEKNKNKITTYEKKSLKKLIEKEIEKELKKRGDINANK